MSIQRMILATLFAVCATSLTALAADASAPAPKHFRAVVILVQRNLKVPMPSHTRQPKW